MLSFAILITHLFLFFLPRITVLLSAQLLQAAFVKQALYIRDNILREHITGILLLDIVPIDNNALSLIGFLLAHNFVDCIRSKSTLICELSHTDGL